MTTTLFDAGHHAATTAPKPLTAARARVNMANALRRSDDHAIRYWNGYLSGLEYRQPTPETCTQAETPPVEEDDDDIEETETW